GGPAGEGNHEGRSGERQPARGGAGEGDAERGRADPLHPGEGEGGVHLGEVIGEVAALVAGGEVKFKIGRILPRVQRAGCVITVHSSPPSTFSTACAIPGGRGRVSTRPCRWGSPAFRRC